MAADDAAARRALERLERALGYRFDERTLLARALTHSSHAHERDPGSSSHYERLEFLGDALLGLLVAEWLYHDDADAPEGTLSRRRQSVVRTSTLAAAAVTLGLDRAIRLGRGEEQTGGREKPTLLADLFEAILAAIYLDGGIRAARSFVRRALGERLRVTRATTRGAEDFKTRLQEVLQGRLRRAPRYRIVSTSGPPHAAVFEVEALLDDDVLGRGTGGSRKQAEQEAARRALLALGAPEG